MKVSVGALAILSLAYLFLWLPLFWLGLRFLVVPMALSVAGIVAGLFMIAAPAALIGFLWWLVCREGLPNART